MATPKVVRGGNVLDLGAEIGYTAPVQASWWAPFESEAGNLMLQKSAGRKRVRRNNGGVPTNGAAKAMGSMRGHMKDHSHRRLFGRHKGAYFLHQQPGARQAGEIQHSGRVRVYGRQS